jgi:hypothetical protein
MEQPENQKESKYGKPFREQVKHHLQRVKRIKTPKGKRSAAEQQKKIHVEGAARNEEPAAGVQPVRLPQTKLPAHPHETSGTSS